jgi:hypothetical protein
MYKTLFSVIVVVALLYVGNKQFEDGKLDWLLLKAYDAAPNLCYQIARYHGCRGGDGGDDDNDAPTEQPNDPCPIVSASCVNGKCHYHTLCFYQYWFPGLFGPNVTR